MNEVRLLIDNRDVSARNHLTFDRRSPLDSQIVSRAAAATVDDARMAVDSAEAARPAWAAMAPQTRRRLLLKAADVLEARAGEFGELMRAETGASSAWSGFNVHLAAVMLREAAALVTHVKGEVIPSDTPGCLAFTVRRPAGVVLGIAPWNAPVILGVRAVATPLACGNTVVLKASEMCPATHRLIGDVMRESGFPAGVLNVVTHAPSDASNVVSALIAHPGVRRINFTGSTRVGRIVAKLAAEYLKPVLLELGGKAPLIVLEDADLEEAVAAAAFGSYMNSGQICMSTERIIVDARIAAEFTARFTEKLMELRAEDPRKGNTPLASIIDPISVVHIQELIDDAVAKGAKLSRAAEDAGTLLSATLLDGVTADMRIYKEESFGPVATILHATSEDDAVRMANDSEYGLSSSIFSRDISRALRIASRIDAGMCHINGPTVHDEPQMPFGGTKQSGYGRFGGLAAVAEFTELQWITIATAKGSYPI